jgi:hypothetical protein
MCSPFSRAFARFPGRLAGAGRGLLFTVDVGRGLPSAETTVSDQKNGVAKTAHRFSFVLAGRFVRPREGGVTERARCSAAIFRVLGAIVDDGHEGNGQWWSNVAGGTMFGAGRKVNGVT